MPVLGATAGTVGMIESLACGAGAGELMSLKKLSKESLALEFESKFDLFAGLELMVEVLRPRRSELVRELAADGVRFTSLRSFGLLEVP